MTFDKSLLKPCPVLLPTAEEFSSPIDYLSSKSVAELGRKYGLVKIVPPKNWKPPFSLAPTFTFHTRMQKISDLGITTRSRKFFTDNLNRFFKMSGRREVNKWFRCSDRKIYYYDLYLAVGKKFPGQTSLDNVSAEELSKLNLLFDLPASASFLKHEYDQYIRAYAEFLSNNGNNYDFPDSDPEDEGSCLICRKNNSPTQTLLCDHCNNPFHMRCLQPQLTEIPTGSWYCDRCLIGTGAYGFEEKPDVKYNIWGFAEYCSEFEKQFLAENTNGGRTVSLDDIEKMFWNLVEAENSELKVKYGADIHNLKPGEISGFPTPEVPTSPYDTNADTSKYLNHPWNLTRLPFAKGSLLNFINSSISGMTVPWIYVGSLLSTFCWHVEDHYTLSANYCHFGNVKKWYGIPSDFADKFENLMKAQAPDLFQRQPDLLHQLVTLMSPSKLAEKGIPCVYADQGPNEFVVTFPRVYHAGFNSGFNFNEAVNFTMDSWIDFGERSIVDYKAIKKENVFDHFQLVENILTAFTLLDHAITKDRIELVSKCIRSYERFVDRQMKLVNSLDKERFELTEVAPKKVNSEPRHIPETRMLSMKKFKPASDDDDVLCDVCRTYVSYQYCNINNQHHRFGRWYVGRPRKSAILTVNKLLTPEASPYSIQMLTDDKKAAMVAESISAERIQDLQEKVPSHDEFEELILRAKRKAEEDNKFSKRRHSSRLQQSSPEPKIEPVKEEPQKMSPMRKVQHNSLLRQLNQYDNIKLCLECCILMCGDKGQRAPRGSQIVFEKQFAQMDGILREAKQKYYTITK